MTRNLEDNKSRTSHPPLDGNSTLSLGDYGRDHVCNANDDLTVQLFNAGLRLLLSYHHEEAARYFISCTVQSPDCALAHAMVALCHGPNYNFNKENYYHTDPVDFEEHEDEGPIDMDDQDTYMSVDKYEADIQQHRHADSQSPSHSLIDEDEETDHLYPSQHLAQHHAKLAVDKMKELRERYKGPKVKQGKRKSRLSVVQRKRQQQQSTQNTKDDSQMINDLETQLINAIHILSCSPGLDASLAEDTVGRPYADAMKKIYKRYPEDAEVACFYAEALMILNAWDLYEYPSGRALSDDVAEVRMVLESSLKLYPQHAGLCHLYVHLSEMSPEPEKALPACDVLRTSFPDAGHLVHMPTHIDALLGNYEDCVRYNAAAITADTKAMKLIKGPSSTSSFYFGYVVHNYHMLIYGAVIGAMEKKAMDCAAELNSYLKESLFEENPDLTSYLEAYATMDVHVLVRFGRWKEILDLPLPNDPKLMLYRAASLRYARALAYANTKKTESAKVEAKELDKLRARPDAPHRNLHNNAVSDLLTVDSVMLKGEIAYFEGRHEEAFQHLRKAISLQDNLNYDEPWGKMQPIRHALGGLLLKQGQVEESEQVYRTDLKRLPNNPWSLIGLMNCLNFKLQQENSTGCQCKAKVQNEELKELQVIFDKQRASEWADFNVTHSCACCHSSNGTSCCAS